MSKFLISASSLLALLIFLSQCDKKMLSLSPEEFPQEIEDEPITYERTDRNDIPPPPVYPWYTLDTSQLTPCQSNLWTYFETFYPIVDSLNLDYKLYSIVNQPEAVFLHTKFVDRYILYFADYFPENYFYNTDYSCRTELDTTFFHQAVGPPTCIVENDIDNVFSYYYHIKLRFRHGPCPFTTSNGDAIGSYCSSTQTEYCYSLRAIFSKETGELTYMDFM